MKLPIPAGHAPRVRVLVGVVLLMFATSGRAQVNERQIQLPPLRPVPARRVPVRPPVRPVPAQRQPQARANPQVRRVPPGANSGMARQGGVQRGQTANQLSRANDTAGGRRGERSTGAFAAGNVQPGGFRLPPNARSVPMAGGGAHIFHPDGRQWLVDSNHHVTAYSTRGLQARFNENGRPSLVHFMRPETNILVMRSLRGDRATLGFRPGNVVVVTYGNGRGYVQRPIPARPGYFQRTSLVNGRPSARVYRVYRYGGVIYFRYVPAYTYQPRFYQWAASPWPGPVAYSWGGQQGPGSGYSSGYFAPAQSYPSAAFWLTDFVLAATLQTAYQNHQEYEQSSPSVPPPNGSAAQSAEMSPEVKGAISQEVQAQVTAEQAEAQSGSVASAANGQALPPVLDPNERTIVVSQSLDVPQANGSANASCSLSPGDVVSRTADNLLAGNKVAVSVTASKAGDCPVNTSTQMDFAALQEMHNQFQEQVDTGLSTLASREGSGGLPAGPAANPQPEPQAIAQPDGDVAMVLAQQQTEANGAEAAALDGASGGTAAM